ncbi:polynucleotide adenylyltransferase PcnB [Aquabacterium sp. J223]|uniref:polynucleotide adenylyltransferase PcnB n=1 Tax=Aquabacterium sp. J223 TaxID=2898431 RepID=UPI0021ADFDFF|nr:polynucleotide adenylyltransferase PcnB [Aquabacterium sp. J223]UUX97659.1 polynucleotide adenylyltransferase PcnB [Aquabacterium sp. J223]
MIKKFIDRLLGKPSGPPKPPLGKRREVAAAEHGIDPGLVDERAVKVVRTLQEAGHQAYIVGGAVRDLLCGRRPKDFDVATDATPEQVKALFRRAFIIGRRFRIVHVVHGRGRDHEVIEVSTFRAYLDATAADQVEGNEKTSKAELAGKSHVVDASGRVLRDNVWGPQVEDAARRDFTVNAMYYDPTTQAVVDYHGGLKDAKAKLLRMIGDPATRYREDPVRILRVVRFAAKLGFSIEPKTRAPIAETLPLLANVPASRLFDEMVKLLQTGHALASLEQIKAHGLHRGVFPVLDAVLDDRKPNPQRDHFVRLALTDTDKRVEEDRPVAPSFLLACLLWHEVLERWNRLKADGESVTPALAQAIDQVFDARIGDISGRGKLGADMREIWMMQPRFERRVGATPFSLVEQPRFRAGFDFLRLRADAGEAPTELADWWEDFALGTPEEREGLVQAAREAQAQSRKPARGGGRVHRAPREDGAVPTEPAMAIAASDDGAEGGDVGEGGAGPARKRRRRRRKPAGAGAPAEAGAAGGE